MATASPTPLGSYSSLGRMRSQSSIRPRRDSPLSALGQSQGFSANAPMMQNIDIGDSSDDEIPQPMKLSALTTALLAQKEIASPEKATGRQPKLRISRTSEGSPVQSTVTPAPSLRVKRVQVRGAPVRRLRRTPQSEEDHHPPSQDQENIPMSVVKVDSMAAPDSVMKVQESAMKVQGSVMKVADDTRPPPPPQSPLQRQDRPERPPPLQPLSANTPRRPAPPPPPKMSVLETATATAGAATTKQRERKRRSALVVNGKQYTQLDRIGKGGSSAVYRVMAENFRQLALKKVKLDDVDEATVCGYKGEIKLLEKLKHVERVIRLYDYEVDTTRNMLSMLLEIGESDLARIIRLKLDTADAKLDLAFTRYYWKEMLECVGAVHEHDIVHSDLKPANFLLVQGRLKLIDFGIANAIDTDNTVNVHRDNFVGTPNYMSPESLEDSSATRGKPHPGSAKDIRIGKPSDIWSLACILYQMVYGKPPFAQFPTQMARALAIVNREYEIEFPDFGIGGVRVPPGLKGTMRRCLNRDPEKRPTIDQLLTDNDRFLFPDGGEDNLPVSKMILAQIIQKVADKFMDPEKTPPTAAQLREYPDAFYDRIRHLLET